MEQSRGGAQPACDGLHNIRRWREVSAHGGSLCSVNRPGSKHTCARAHGLCCALGLQAYGVQLGFMSKVLQALGSQENALLEAPTGSGKTLSLLCAALSWQRKLKADGCVQRYAAPFLSSLTLASCEGTGSDTVAAHLDV